MHTPTLTTSAIATLLSLLVCSTANATPLYRYKQAVPGITAVIPVAPGKAALPQNCTIDSSNQAWCVSPPGLSGLEACGYATGYAGPYYQVTPAAATALGKSILDYGDCGTNYTVYQHPEQVRGWSGGGYPGIPVCSSTPEGLAAKWSRALGGTQSAVVRCTNYE